MEGTQNAIRALKLEIVDDSGKARIVMEIDPDIGAVLRIKDEKGNVRAALGMGAVLLEAVGNEIETRRTLKHTNAPSLILYNEDGSVISKIPPNR